ncbi:hypothetical protein BH11CYA1_BH11CYA1_29890 [soil metagenome]
MRKFSSFLVLLALISVSRVTAAQETVAQLGPFAAPDKLNIFVRAEGPATRVTPLQAACFFEHQVEGDQLSGGTKSFDDQMGGLIKKLRDSGDFTGHELETLLITPLPGTVPAKKLLLIGLGDPKTFTAARMKNIGLVAAREACKLNVDKFSLSPNVTDAGVTTVKVADFDQQLVQGFVEGIAIQKKLAAQKLVPKVVLT